GGGGGGAGRGGRRGFFLGAAPAVFYTEGPPRRPGGWRAPPPFPLRQDARPMDELHHECGIAALYHLEGPASRLAPLAGPEQVSRLMPRLLLDLQNRGQLAAGMATFN